MKTENIKAVAKEIVIRYWVAVLPDGKEVEIRGINKKKLKEGMELTGDYIETDEQNKYEDGTYARSYSVIEYLQVKNKLNENK